MGLTDIGSERVVSTCPNEDMVSVEGHRVAKPVARGGRRVIEGLQDDPGGGVEQLGADDDVVTVDSYRGRAGDGASRAEGL